nr:hypothetical protein BaRGS_031604 [Batillaria attramentaria]
MDASTLFASSHLLCADPRLLCASTLLICMDASTLFANSHLLCADPHFLCAGFLMLCDWASSTVSIKALLVHFRVINQYRYLCASFGTETFAGGFIKNGSEKAQRV